MKQSGIQEILKALELYFAQVDKRFEEVNRRFDRQDKKFNWNPCRIN